MSSPNYHAWEETTHQSVAPMGEAEQHDLTEATLAHIEAVSHHAREHSNEALIPPPGCPAGSLFKRIRVGSRNSTLALIQTNHVVAALFKFHHGFSFPVSTHSVQGDVFKSAPFLKVSQELQRTDSNAAKSLWTMEIEEKLLANEIDIIVHSLKDMPTHLPEGCAIGCIPQRLDPTDAFVVKAGLPYKSIQELPAGAVVGTSSIRRTAQLKHYYQYLDIRECRGNVDSRVKKLDAADSPFSAIVVATAGLIRLNLEHRITARLSAPTFLHAVGQGALGIEVRAKDPETLRLIRAIEHRPTRLMCLAERSLLRFLQGGCSAPIGVHSAYHAAEQPARGMGAPEAFGVKGEDGGDRGVLELIGTILHPEGGVEIRARQSGHVESDADAEGLGVTVGRKMIELGADRLLDTIAKFQLASVSSKPIVNGA